MPRIKSSPRKCVKSRTGQSKSWIVLAPDDVMKPSSNATPDLAKLRHPRSGLPAMFLFSADNSTVQEILAYQEKKSSWFVNDTVQEDGKMHISTPIDPVFLVLPYLKKASEEGKVMPLEDLLVDPGFPETRRLINNSALKYISCIADRKGMEDLNAWLYNEEKAMKWLQGKAENVALALKEGGLNVDGSAVSQTYVMTSNQKETNVSAYMSYAYGLLSEYLPDDVAAKLRQHLKIPEEEVRKRKVSTEAGNLTKRPKIEESDTRFPPAEKPPAKKGPSAKEKSQVKAASGSKSITSFFKKK